MTRAIFVKHLQSLRPTDEASEELLRHIGQGELVSVEIKRPRHLGWHRRYFAMLQIVFANQSYYKSLDDLLDVCKLAVGHYRTVRTKQGDVRIPKSISFASMDQTEFEAFYDRACDWVSQEVIPGLQRHDLDEEVRLQLEEIAGLRREGEAVR